MRGLGVAGWTKWLGWGCWAWAVTAQAGNVAQLQCVFDLNGERSTQVFGLSADPYRTPSVNLADRFRFKAVLVGQGTAVDRVDLYVSQLTERQPMILQHAHYARPTVLPNAQNHSLTGQVAVYAAWLGKELRYGCSLYEVPGP